MTNMESLKSKLIEELKRLSDEAPSGSCSRRYWRKHSDISEHAVRREFGTFTAFQKSAGIGYKRNTVAAFGRKAKLVEEVDFQDYMTKCVLPWSKPIKEREVDHVSLMVASDFHGEHADPFAMEVWLDTIRRIKPDHIALNGDIAEFSPVGRWAKNPNIINNLQNDVDATEHIVAQTRLAAGPECQISFFIGNHEDRICRFLAEQAPGLASLRCLSFGELFNLTEHNVDLVIGGNILAPTESERRTELAKSYRVYYNTFVVTHGTATGPGAASAELKRFQMSGCSGHLHKHSYASGSSLDRPHMEWNIMPKMTRDSVAEVYGGGLPMGWQTGFAVVDIFPETRTHFFHPVHIRNKMAMSCGVLYRDQS